MILLMAAPSPALSPGMRQATLAPSSLHIPIIYLYGHPSLAKQARRVRASAVQVCFGFTSSITRHYIDVGPATRSWLSLPVFRTVSHHHACSMERCEPPRGAPTGTVTVAAGRVSMLHGRHEAFAVLKRVCLGLTTVDSSRLQRQCQADHPRRRFGYQQWCRITPCSCCWQVLSWL